MSEPTPGERDFAARHNIDPVVLARARDLLNIIVSEPWPRTEQISALARVARTTKSDVGPMLAALALERAPVHEFHALMEVKGLAEKRVIGLAKALANADVSGFTPKADALLAALDRISALTGENAALRAEVDRIRAALDRASGSTAFPETVVRLEDVASSIGEQLVAADQNLRLSARGLRLGAVELRVQGAASVVGQDVALDLAAPGGGSAVGLRFATGTSPQSGDVPVPLIDVRGYGPALARRKLTEQGFNVVFVRAAAAEAARGVVSEQAPAPGAFVFPGAVVRLTLS